MQSDYLPIFTYSSSVDPVDPVDCALTIKRSSGKVARKLAPARFPYARPFAGIS